MSLHSINNGVIQVGVDDSMGGSIGEFKLVGGSNYVDNSLPGRQIGLSIYDGNGTYTSFGGGGDWGWNPVHSGDTYEHRSPIIESYYSSTLLYTKAQALEWFPDNKGGGSTTAILSNAFFKQYVEFVPQLPKAVKVTNSITYLDSTVRSNNEQEMPSIYLVGAYANLSRYSGTNPWRNEPLTLVADPPGGVNYYASERWAALIDDSNDGVGVYGTGYFPYFAATSFPAAVPPTNYLRPYLFNPFNNVDETRFVYYLTLGAIADIRETFTQLHMRLTQQNNVTLGYHR